MTRDSKSLLASMVVAVVVMTWLTLADQSKAQLKANQVCQPLGFSAGHYDREFGIVCEQWTPAAKVRP